MKKNKYNAIPTFVGEIRFASKAEAKRYQELLQMVGNKEITFLELQPKYPIHIGEVKICTYIADFRYMDTNGKTHVEDVKGRETAMFRLKKKLVEAVYEGTKIEIVK